MLIPKHILCTLSILKMYLLLPMFSLYFGNHAVETAVKVSDILKDSLTENSLILQTFFYYQFLLYSSPIQYIQTAVIPPLFHASLSTLSPRSVAQLPFTKEQTSQ